MNEAAWVKEFPASITVCDAAGTILAMNDRSARTFAADGGAGLIGKNLYDCHPGLAREKVSALLASGSPNCYTIEKGRCEETHLPVSLVRVGNVPRVCRDLHPDTGADASFCQIMTRRHTTR